jgi:hypothetical protein
MYRQGDILIIPANEKEIQAAQEKGSAVARENDRLILAYGESSGHAHAIAEKHVDLLTYQGARFLVAESLFTLSHEEHNPIAIPAGQYRVVRQREFNPSIDHPIQYVAD